MSIELRCTWPKQTDRFVFLEEELFSEPSAERKGELGSGPFIGVAPM